jgi:paraquat-inducible protein B
MTEFEHEKEDRRHEEEEANQAQVKVGRWSPWVWIVPVVAIFIVGYLVVRYGFFGGGDITVRFAEARGLDRYSPVRFRGAKVGTVQKITIDENLKEVVVRITMDASMNHALRKDTRFWIVEPGIEGGGLGGLLSGTYVGISPGSGEETREFVGQEYPPVLAAPEEGKTLILEGKGAGAITAGTPVIFEGIRVGRVLGTAYDETRETISVHVFVVQRFANHVRQSTRFWHGGGLDISLGGGGISMGGASLSSFLQAPVSFYTPEVLAGAPVADRTRFELYDSRAAAIAAADGPHLTYLTFFPGPIGGLKPGTPVQMKGMQVGRVRDVRLRYVSQTASLETPVILEIDPRLLELGVSETTTRADLRRVLNEVLQALVQRGMRATLATSLVLPGASAVNLDFVAPPGTGRLVVTNDPPIIPAASRGQGLENAMAAITDVANTIRGLPLQEIAENVRSTTRRLDAIVNDPVLDDSLRRLNRSLIEIERVAATAGENIGPMAESLRNAADAAASAAKRAEQLMGTAQKQGYDVSELVKELTRAAEAVRALSQYLTENPDALLKGRSDK